MKAQNEIEASCHSIASRWTRRCSQWMISRFSLWIPPPTHRLAAPSARQGRKPARKLCRCSSNSSSSEVPYTHRQFDNTICMLAMLGPSAWFCISQVEFRASLTRQCFFWLVKCNLWAYRWSLMHEESRTQTRCLCVSCFVVKKNNLYSLTLSHFIKQTAVFCKCQNQMLLYI